MICNIEEKTKPNVRVTTIAKISIDQIQDLVNYYTNQLYFI